MLHTIDITTAMTITNTILTFPITFYITKIATPTTHSILTITILIPL